MPKMTVLISQNDRYFYQNDRYKVKLTKMIVFRGTGHLANNLANFELANQILVGEPNFNLANTNEYFANPNKIWRTEMRLGERPFELRELLNFHHQKFTKIYRSKIKVIILAR